MQNAARSRRDVGQVESEPEQVLTEVLRSQVPLIGGLVPKVQIRENNKDKRDDASIEGWHPPSGEIRITFEAPAWDGSPAKAPSTGNRERSSPIDPPGGIVRLLDSEEHRLGFSFVALKRFRDEASPKAQGEWARVQEERDRMIRNALEGQILLGYKVPNPKTSAFPTTAIRLNRQHHEVAKALGSVPEDTGFRPIQSRGKTLASDIILTQRR